MKMATANCFSVALEMALDSSVALGVYEAPFLADESTGFLEEGNETVGWRLGFLYSTGEGENGGSRESLD